MSGAARRRKGAGPATTTPAGRAGAERRRHDAPEETRGPAERRRASRSLWEACEAFLSPAEPALMNHALDSLRAAFDCDGVALHALGPSGGIEPWVARGAWRTRAGDLRDCVTVPLMRGPERVGSLELLARAGHSWDPAQLTLMRTAAGALGAALGARLELERLRRQPGRDPVTGLPDAHAFHHRFAEELARSRRHGVPLAVLEVDLDHFGALNARHGRAAGDAVLSETALVLKLQLRESDVLSRLGGDAFAMVLPETDAGPALRCADRIRRAIEEHRFARVGRISVSAGVASCPRDGVEPLELLNCAEQALGIAKKSGRRRVVGAAHAHAH
jgi:diguanylate cyclase (GGDEF)-like protein